MENQKLFKKNKEDCLYPGMKSSKGHITIKYQKQSDTKESPFTIPNLRGLIGLVYFVSVIGNKRSFKDSQVLYVGKTISSFNDRYSSAAKKNKLMGKLESGYLDENHVYRKAFPSTGYLNIKFLDVINPGACEQMLLNTFHFPSNSDSKCKLESKYFDKFQTIDHFLGSLGEEDHYCNNYRNWVDKLIVSEHNNGSKILNHHKRRNMSQINQHWVEDPTFLEEFNQKLIF